MRRIAFVLVPCALLLVAFYAWHMPLRGPLSDAEIDAFMADQAASAGDAWTDAKAFEAFLRADDGRPFVMINLMELRDVAAYPEGYVSAPVSGEEAGAAYGQAVSKLLLQRGSYPMAQAARSHTIINSLGAEVGAFEKLVVVRYRSRRDLIDMLMSEAFREANPHKWASLENTIVAPAKTIPSLQIVSYVPVMVLLCMGILLGQAVWGQRRPNTSRKMLES